MALNKIALVKTLLSLVNGVFFNTLQMALDKFKELVSHEEAKLDKCYENDKEALEKENEGRKKTTLQEQEKFNKVGIAMKAKIRLLFGDEEDEEDVTRGNKRRYNVFTYNYAMKKVEERIKTGDVSFREKLEELGLWHEVDEFGCEGHYGDEYLALSTIRRNFYNSMVFSIYTTIKKHLIGICEYLTVLETSETGIRNVEDAVSYLKTCGWASFEKHEEGFLRELKELCHLIAEEDGELSSKTDDEKAEIRNMALNVPIEQVDVRDFETNEFQKTDKCIDLNPEFLELCFQRGEGFLGKVMKQIFEKLDNMDKDAPLRGAE